MSFNKAILIGNITKAPELKQTPNGVSVCSFDIAVNRKLNKDEVDFISIVARRIPIIIIERGVHILPVAIIIL